MKITFNTIIKCYLVILMVLSLLIISDRLTERTSKPMIIQDQINPVILVIKKGCLFPSRIEQL